MKLIYIRIFDLVEFNLDKLKLHNKIFKRIKKNDFIFSLINHV